jgi:flagellar hook-basal body complex protein FliE
MQMRMMSSQSQGVSPQMQTGIAGIQSELATGSVAGTAASPLSDFSNVLSQAIGKVNSLENEASNLKVKFENNEPDVNLVDVMLASQKASMAFQGTVQVRNKLIAAYQDVMNMQV